MRRGLHVGTGLLDAGDAGGISEAAIGGSLCGEGCSACDSVVFGCGT